MNRMGNGSRFVTLVLAVLWTGSGGVGAQAAEGTWAAVGVDSRAFGTVTARWESEGKGLDRWTWGVGAQVSLPLLLVVKGGGFDTAALEVEGLVDWAFEEGWFLRGRLTTGVSTQTQVLGTLTSWTGGLGFEPGYRGGWGELWLVVRPQGALVTVVRPSSYAKATFDERYEDGPPGTAPASVVLGFSAFRVLTGIGFRVTVTHALSLGLVLGVYPPRYPERVGWMDGFSFGEIPFYSRFDCRIRL